MKSEKQVMDLTKDKEILLKQQEAALQEAKMWQTELAKARDQRAVLEASLARADEKARVSEAGADAQVKEASGRLEAIQKERDELLSLVRSLQSQLHRYLFVIVFVFINLCQPSLKCHRLLFLPVKWKFGMPNSFMSLA